MANDTTKTNDDIMTIKRAYHRVQTRSLAKTPAEFNAAVASRLLDHNITPDEAKPEEWLRAARLVGFMCRRCAGTGQFITQVVNGKPTGPGGICYRCDGKGWQNDRDRRRNYGYDNYAAAKAVHADMNKGAHVCDNCGEPATSYWNEPDGQTPYCDECWEGRADGESQMAMEA